MEARAFGHLYWRSLSLRMLSATMSLSWFAPVTELFHTFLSDTVLISRYSKSLGMEISFIPLWEAYGEFPVAILFLLSPEFFDTYFYFQGRACSGCSTFTEGSVRMQNPNSLVSATDFLLEFFSRIRHRCFAGNLCIDFTFVHNTHLPRNLVQVHEMDCWDQFQKPTLHSAPLRFLMHYQYNPPRASLDRQIIPSPAKFSFHEPLQQTRLVCFPSPILAALVCLRRQRSGGIKE